MHSCTVRCRKETSYRKDMESLTPTNRTATSKQFQDRKRETRLRGPAAWPPPRPEVEAPSRAAKPVFSLPTVVSAGQRHPHHPPRPCPAPAVTGPPVLMGVCVLIRKIGNASLRHGRQACHGHRPAPPGPLGMPGRHRLG